MATDTQGRTFEEVMALVKAGAEAAASLLPFLMGARTIYQQVMEAWAVRGMDREQVKAHILGSEAEVRALVAWWDTYEPVKHPSSKLP